MWRNTSTGTLILAGMKFVHSPLGYISRLGRIGVDDVVGECVEVASDSFSDSLSGVFSITRNLSIEQRAYVNLSQSRLDCITRFCTSVRGACSSVI